MAGSVNKVILVGRLGQDPEVRYTQGGTPVANIRIATDETWKDQSGERQQRTGVAHGCPLAETGGNLRPVPQQGKAGLHRGEIADPELAGQGGKQALLHRGTGRQHGHAGRPIRGRTGGAGSPTRRRGRFGLRDLRRRHPILARPLPCSSASRSALTEFSPETGWRLRGTFTRQPTSSGGETAALLFLTRPPRQEDPAESQFLQKLALYATLDHSNLARLFPIETHDGHHILPMEFIHGKTLAEIIAGGPCDFDLALQTAIQTVRALLEVHENGLVHSRLTSRSLFLQEGNQVKLLDIVLPYLPPGLVLQDPEDPESREPELPAGQPPLLHLSYRAPEQVRGEPGDARSDLFSLGGRALRIIAGGVSLYGWGRDRTGPADSGPGASPADFRATPNLSGWSRLLGALLQKDPADRYPFRLRAVE